jgi:hypothetical protein
MGRSPGLTRQEAGGSKGPTHRGQNVGTAAALEGHADVTRRRRSHRLPWIPAMEADERDDGGRGRRILVYTAR